MSGARRCIATTERVTILGAGIGGLAAAIACGRTARDVTVIEQAPALTEVGAGVQIAPNGMRVLRDLRVDVPGLANTAVKICDGLTGRSLVRMPLGPDFLLVHRADLIDALAAALPAARVRLRLGQVVAGLAPGQVTLASGAHLDAPRIIGADGARGPSRRHVAAHHEARFTGQVAWRAIVRVRDWPHEAQVHTAPGRHIVCYPLRDGTYLNIVAVQERESWSDASWSQRDDPANLRAAFADFAPAMQRELAKVEAVNLWGLMDHGVTPEWHRDGCTLIGDAAHPTLPFLAQGANLALEDAWLVARHLDTPERFVAARKPRVTRALAAAAANARSYHLAGVPRRGAHLALRLAGLTLPSLLLRKYDWLYGYDVTQAP
ncbi:MAG: FAD-dependent monooxygenase [Pseudomonadota bacterium]